ncbi:MAG: DUF4304 domain-containing protein [Dysgonomonas sp.]|nr:DUF4304 domain-containing protein [Dysgonomonas sp.]
MAKTETERKFDYMVSKIIWPPFKAMGYKKSGNNFRYYNSEEGWGKIVNFQKSMFYNKENIHFTVNVGIFSEKVYQYFSQSPGDKFKEYNCTIRERIGSLMNTNDTWYDINEETDVDKIYLKIEQIFVKYVHPFLNKFQSEKDILNELLNKTSLNIPEIKALYYNGYAQRAMQELEKEINNARKAESYRERLLELKQELDNITN